MTRHAVLFKLKDAACKEEYKKRHDTIWKEVASVLKKAGYKNYSIWNYGDLLFGYYEMDSENEGKSDEILFGNEFFLKWRNYMEDIIYIEPETGRKEWPLELMFLQE
jgi:L-rhamnose mutarotase